VKIYKQGTCCLESGEDRKKVMGWRFGVSSRMLLVSCSNALTTRSMIIVSQSAIQYRLYVECMNWGHVQNSCLGLSSNNS